MSVDIHWDALTTGPDGEKLAETVRAFIDDKFQQVTLPRFIRGIRVHSFDVGSIPPKVEIKDICDPLPDFYDEHQDGYSSQSDGCQDFASDQTPATQSALGEPNNARTRERFSAEDVPTADLSHARESQVSSTDSKTRRTRGAISALDYPTTPLFANLQSPGFPGGTSNLNYFHLPFGPGLSGTATPLAAVTGAHFQSSWADHTLHNKINRPLETAQDRPHTPPSVSDLSSRPQSQDQDVDLRDGEDSTPGRLSAANIQKINSLPNEDKDPNDIQIVAHVEYAGDLKLSLTAEILLDYPMPSFVGIPLQLKITGLKFDGIAVLAYLKKRAHVCFLSPEDAEAFVDQPDPANEDGIQTLKFGGLLEEIKVESEIGEKDNGKQVLKNVGKVEKFILEQVRRIFEDEFVYPSFWTFLV